jgi:hypothetical protein
MNSVDGMGLGGNMRVMKVKAANSVDTIACWLILDEESRRTAATAAASAAAGVMQQ